MRTRFARRVCVAVVSIGALLSSTALPSAAVPGPMERRTATGPGIRMDARLHGKIVKMLRHMTLRGEGRAAVRRRGVRPGRRHRVPGHGGPEPGAVRRGHSGAGHRQVQAGRGDLLRRPARARQRAEPTADRDAVQRAAGGRRRPAAADPAAHLHRSGGRRGRLPAHRAGDRDARQHGPRRGPIHGGRTPLGRGDRHRTGGGRDQPELRAGRRRQRQPRQPGHRRTVGRRGPRTGVRHGRRPGGRLPRRRRGHRRQALPGPRRHRRGQPFRPAGGHTHPRAARGDRPAAVPGRHRRAASTRS